MKAKQLTNVRASGKDEAIRLTPPRRPTLEQAIAYIEEDELVEVTPKSIRLRKQVLNPSFRKKRRARKRRSAGLPAKREAQRWRGQPCRCAAAPGRRMAAAARSAYPTSAAKCADLVVHIVGLTLALVGGIILLMLAVRPARSAGWSASIYRRGVLAMLAFSTAYNFAKARYRPVLRRLDHAGIFLMIAGSYTPFTIHNLTGAWAWGMTTAVWSIAAVGALGKLLLPKIDRRIWRRRLPGAGLAGGGGAEADDRPRLLGRPAAAAGRRRALFDGRDLLREQAPEVRPRHLARPRGRRRRRPLGRGAAGRGAGQPQLRRRRSIQMSPRA